MNENFIDLLKKEILILDGGLGTMLQKYKFNDKDFRGREFLDHPTSLYGFNDILNLTKPSAIKEIHKAYLAAGANIITTNTFNSNAISMKDYGLDHKEGLIRRLNREGAEIARTAAKEYLKTEKKDKIFIGGSIGPTNRSASMSPDISDPLKRNISYKELFETYKEQVRGLIEGGVDLLICETFFDTLNLKAALDASNSVMRETGNCLPILVSATISDKAGHLLSGQTIEAFYASVADYDNIISIGLNCGFGPDRMKEYIKTLNRVNCHYTSCHPNAGLPDESGCYDVSPEQFAESIKELIIDKHLNIVGGCCGTTPAHIKALKEIVKDAIPRIPLKNTNFLMVSGLEAEIIQDKFIIVGERCNVAGSAKFLRLIQENALEEAAEIARSQVRKGAGIIDINMDDPLLDAKEEMIKFLRYLLADPDVARLPFMIDSSKWDVIESALMEIQGKGIVNSLSLKEGEEVFIKKAQRIRNLGFALIVMAFDEKGQADSYERKIEVCERAYRLLTETCGYKPTDIIFDVNVMTIATGMPEHSKYAVDFLKAVKWIKSNLPGARTSGGISNLSFAFRGKNKLREYMHAVFLHHAKKAGLDMAIINPAQKTQYQDIPLDIRNVIEDVIFDRDVNAVEKLVEIANESDLQGKNLSKISQELNSQATIDEILRDDLIKGELLKLDSHLEIALKEIGDPIKIIEGPLLNGMKKVGELFGEGKMFLPQVVKTARSMKKAVEILMPTIESTKKEDSEKKAGKILIATVKGDVHDIGKNIVSTVLSCNNYQIIDLGIMVPPEKIVETALSEKPDIICLSGLITPSLAEMKETVVQLKAAGISVPIMVGGAATSAIHTALKISPEYAGPVLHMTDASCNPIAANNLLNPSIREGYLNEINESQRKLRQKNSEKKNIIPFNEVLRIAEEKRREKQSFDYPVIKTGLIDIIDIPLNKIIPLINWKMFFIAWKIQGQHIDNFPIAGDEKEMKNWIAQQPNELKPKALEALQLYNEARKILDSLIRNSQFDGKGIIRFEKAEANLYSLKINDVEFPMLRQQREGTELLSVTDYFPDKKGIIGLFAVTAGKQIYDLVNSFEKNFDSYGALVAQTLADRLAEASAEWLQEEISKQYTKIFIRPAWGYPMMPDQKLILKTQYFLPYKEINVSLTENGAMYPPATISGIYILNPDSKYFVIGEIGDDQIADYANRRGLTINEAKDLLRYI